MVKVREAAEADIPYILELYRQLALNPASDVSGPSPETCLQVFTRMKAMPGYSLLVAEEDDRVVGTTVVAVLPVLSHSGRPFAVVEHVVVDEEYRGRGIGKAMMLHTMDLAKDAGRYKLMLTSDNRRQEAHDFHHAIGFEASAHGFRYYF